MKVSEESTGFNPITITLETREEVESVLSLATAALNHPHKDVRSLATDIFAAVSAELKT